MTPIDNPFHLVSGSADALCQAVTGHALFVPSDLAAGVSHVGMFMVLSACILIVAVAFAVGYIVRQWTRHFPPGPKIAKPPYDTLTSALALIGLLVGFSAAAMATRNTTSPVLAMVYMAATLLWIQVTPHVVVLLRSKP